MNNFDKSRGYNLIGKKFGMLQITGYHGVDKRGERLWDCVCDCGKSKVAKSYDLRVGRTDSCGCMRNKRIIEANTTHGEIKTRLYRIWANMKTRCSNPKTREFLIYGGKGIKVCAEWDNFINFRDWSMANGYTDKLSIDRIENELDYSPNNCRWVTMQEQQNNRSNNRFINLNGEVDTMANWSRRLGIKYNVLQHQLNKGKSLEEIINEQN